MFLWEKRMAKKSLDDWRKAWDDAPGSFEKKTSVLLRQYVFDSKIDVAGMLSPMTWFAVAEQFEPAHRGYAQPKAASARWRSRCGARDAGQFG